jgi:hypothetical protein
MDTRNGGCQPKCFERTLYQLQGIRHSKIVSEIKLDMNQDQPDLLSRLKDLHLPDLTRLGNQPYLINLTIWNSIQKAGISRDKYLEFNNYSYDPVSFYLLASLCERVTRIMKENMDVKFTEDGMKITGSIDKVLRFLNVAHTLNPLYGIKMQSFEILNISFESPLLKKRKNLLIEAFSNFLDSIDLQSLNTKTRFIYKLNLKLWSKYFRCLFHGRGETRFNPNSSRTWKFLRKIMVICSWISSSNSTFKIQDIMIKNKEILASKDFRKKLLDVELHCDGFVCGRKALWIYSKNYIYRVISKIKLNQLIYFQRNSKDDRKSTFRTFLKVEMDPCLLPSNKF